jgi:hypothetical protein
VETIRLQKERKAKEKLEEKHINRSWEKELEGAETFYQRQEKMEGTRRQLMFLMERRTLLLLRYFSAANTACWNINIFNEDRFLLMHIS